MTDFDFDERVLLGLLIERDPALAADDELARALGGEHAAIPTAAGLAGLARDGLAHRLDRCAWATRAAMRCNQLGPI